jgi:cell division protease FtsH
MQNESFHKPFSDETASLIDEEVRLLLQVQYQRAQNLLVEKKAELEKLAHELLAKEVLHKSDLEKLIGPRPYQEEEKFYHPEEVKEADKPQVTEGVQGEEASAPVTEVN